MAKTLRGFVHESPAPKGAPVARATTLCYDMNMITKAKQLLERVSSWPDEDQEELAELAREIEARRSGVYETTLEEEAAIREGIAELDRGEWVSEEEMRDFWKRCGVL
ncbi:MAG: hypothetical protein IT536_00045 [Hyphomicrobiales bacterium]|nr:hypothetical protein [Hyphomicrobiales bacterium]